MAVLTESNRLGAIVKWESGDVKRFSREDVVVAGGAAHGVGTVLGKITKSVPTSGTKDDENTGNGTCTDVTGGAKTQIGTYVLTCIVAAENAGTFEVKAPDGTRLPDATVAVAYENEQINFTLNDGATDFAVGDVFTIAVAAGSGKVDQIDFTKVDGLQDAYGILDGMNEVPTTQKALDFNGGGTYEIRPGDVVTGATSGATARVVSVTLDSGAWADGDAAGTLILDDQVGTFEGENLDVGTNANVATIADDSSDYQPDIAGVAVVRDAVVNDDILVWPTGATAAQKAAALAQLADKGIIVRDAA